GPVLTARADGRAPGRSRRRRRGARRRRARRPPAPRRLVIPSGMQRALVLVSLLLLVPEARADDSYARALHKGRKLEAKGDHAGALKAYDEALAAQPNDPVVLSEVSVSALAAGDLARARDAATRAAKSDAFPRLTAAAYFNLGQVEEKAKDADKAIAAYRS